jgi:hypothetical protein
MHNPIAKATLKQRSRDCYISAGKLIAPQYPETTLGEMYDRIREAEFKIEVKDVEIVLERIAPFQSRDSVKISLQPETFVKFGRRG